MYQTLIQTLAEIGVDVEATETRLTIRSIDQERLRAACTQQVVEEELEKIRQWWYGTPENEQADFYRMVMQAEADWEAAEEEGYDWREDAWDE